VAPPSAAAARAGHRLTLAGIGHRFGDFTAVDGVDLDIAGGELVALLGPSGCGKSTLLRIIAGFVVQTAGSVAFDGASVDHLVPNRRGVGIVFQNYALFPHMSVGENIAYGLTAQRMRKDAIPARVDAMLRLVHMQPHRDKRPAQLSGGQQQRIALARALAVDPKILLLDEPFGALDKNLRLDMQIEVKRLVREYGITTILVTHDQEEALSMADRIAVMNRGRIEQVSPPTDIYDRPGTLFVNQFVGTANLIPGELAGEGIVRLRDGALVPALAVAALPHGSLPPGSAVLLSVRPEHLRVHAQPVEGGFAATVKVVMPLGPQVMYEAEAPGAASLKISAPRHGAPAFVPGQQVFVAPAHASACQVFPATP
jgi:putative spermidine/putrescine transport system ATP-binding protein